MSSRWYQQLRKGEDEEIAARHLLNPPVRDTDSESDSVKPWTQPKRSSRQRANLIHLFLHAISLVAICILVLQSRRTAISIKQLALEETTLYSPLLDVVDRKLSKQKFMGSFRGKSPFKGPPTPEVEAAWSHIVDFEFVNVTRESMIKLGRPLESVQFPADMGHGRGTGGGYLGLFETGHYLHCLRSLWEDHHFDKSHHAQKFKAEMPVEYDEHYEHCVDVLRQRLMCTADPNVITYQWVEGIESPYPNFNTEHKCANFDDLLNYVRENEVAFPKGYKFTAPSDAVKLSSPP